MSRYIDADLIPIRIRLIFSNFQRIAYEEEINKVPTADVRPNTHGSWIPGGDFPVRCSNCGRGSVQPENFCMSCGADMREEKNP